LKKSRASEKKANIPKNLGEEKKPIGAKSGGMGGESQRPGIFTNFERESVIQDPRNKRV